MFPILIFSTCLGFSSLKYKNKSFKGKFYFGISCVTPSFPWFYLHLYLLYPYSQILNNSINWLTSDLILCCKIYFESPFTWELPFLGAPGWLILDFSSCSWDEAPCWALRSLQNQLVPLSSAPPLNCMLFFFSNK